MDLSRLIAALEDESTEATVVVRTDFWDDEAWAAVVNAVSQPIPDVDDDDFSGNLVPVDDPTLAGLTVDALTAELEPRETTAYVVVADARSMTEARSGAPITVDYVDYSPYAREDADDFDTFFGRSFRCEAKEVGSIEVNLSIANMDFSDFADEVGADGVFRGFD
jgi:hypothetical protein